MNFTSEFNKGQKGGNKGIPLGPGLLRLSSTINGVQKSRLYVVAAPPKAGKSTLVDYGFFVQPYLYALEHNLNVEWIYFSLEIDRISKEFDVATHFLFTDHKIERIKLPEGVLVDGKSEILLSPDYLRGRVMDDNGKVVKFDEDIKPLLIKVYNERIIPLFGKYNSDGICVQKGIVTFITQKDNPTGVWKYLKAHASRNGKYIYDGDPKFPRIIGFKPTDPDKYTIVILDHLRKLIPERNWQMKQTVDKMLEYQVELRNLLGYTFVDIIHLNRDMGSQERIRYVKDLLYPTSDDIKDTGNAAEDADYVFTMMNPNDDRYNLQKHFGVAIRDSSGNELYPNMRSIHIVESRHCIYPQHFRTTMKGNVKNFEQLNI